MDRVQRRVIHALRGAPFEKQVASLGFALVFLLTAKCSSPLEELDRLTALMRRLVESALIRDGGRSKDQALKRVH